jgi:hypothetical protein
VGRYFLLSSPQPRFLHLRELKVVASPRASSVAVGSGTGGVSSKLNRPIAAALVRQVRHRLFVCRSNVVWVGLRPSEARQAARDAVPVEGLGLIDSVQRPDRRVRDDRIVGRYMVRWRRAFASCITASEIQGPGQNGPSYEPQDGTT